MLATIIITIVIIIYYCFIDYAKDFVWITINCGKFWKRWEYQTIWPAFWETCMQVRKQQLELDMKQQTGSKQEKESIKAVYCHPAYLTYMQSTSWEMLGWKKHKLESRLLGEISIKIMESGPITSWEIDGEMVETVSDFIFWGSKITAYGDCSLEIKRCLLLWRKVMINLDRIFKCRAITLPTKVHLVKAMVFRWSCMDVRVGLWRKLSAEKLMLLNCGFGKDSWESLGLQGDPTSPS